MAERDDDRTRHLTETFYVIAFGLIMGIIGAKLERAGVSLPWPLGLK